MRLVIATFFLLVALLQNTLSIQTKRCTDADLKNRKGYSMTSLSQAWITNCGAHRKYFCKRSTRENEPGSIRHEDLSSPTSRVSRREERQHVVRLLEEDAHKFLKRSTRRKRLSAKYQSGYICECILKECNQDEMLSYCLEHYNGIYWVDGREVEQCHN